MKSDKKDIILFFISKVLIGIIGIISVSVYSKVLSTEDYGNFSLIVGLVNALISIFIGWIGSSALRYYIDYEDNKEIFYSNINLYMLIMLVIIFIIEIIVGILSTHIPIMKYLLPAILISIFLAYFEVFEKILRASQKTIHYSIGIIGVSLVNLLFILLTIKYISDGTLLLLIASIISHLLFNIFAFIVIGYRIKRGCFDKKILTKFLKFGIPMIGVWGISWLLNYCDRYIISIFLTNSSVGIYEMSYKMSESSINIVITAFTLAVYPILIRIWKNEGKKAVEKKVKETIKYYLIIIIPAIVGLVGIIDKLYITILDSKYVSGKNIILIVSIGLAINGITAIFNKIWQLNEKTKKIFYVLVFSVIANIILNIIFIPIYGIVAAACTTLGSYIISNIITYFWVRKEFKIMLDFISVLKTIFSSAIMFIFIQVFNKYVNNIYMLIVEIMISFIIYFTASIITNNISISKINSFRKEK